MLIGITCVNKNFDPLVFNLQRFHFELQVRILIPGSQNCENKVEVDQIPLDFYTYLNLLNKLDLLVSKSPLVFQDIISKFENGSQAEDHNRYRPR
jgi:hypothetical protein